MCHIKLEQDEKIVCRLKSHWWNYVVWGLVTGLAASEFWIWLDQGTGRNLLNAWVAFLLSVYLFLLAKKQQIVFTNLRVICCGGWLPFTRKIIILPKIKLRQSPILKMANADLYTVELMAAEKKMSFPGLAITKKQLALLEAGYEVNVKNDWPGLRS